MADFLIELNWLQYLSYIQFLTFNFIINRNKILQKINQALAVVIWLKTSGAENLRRVATDATTRGSVTNILRKTDANLRKLQEELNELHAQVARTYCNVDYFIVFVTPVPRLLQLYYLM